MRKWFASQRVLVPFDFSDRSMEAVRLAIELSGPEHKVHVHHVMVDWYPTHPAVVLTDFNEHELKTTTMEALGKAIGAAHIDEDRVELNVTVGDPGSSIAQRAEEIGVSLIVVPSHGRRGITRMFLGSVAERVVRLAKCPVLVLKEATTAS